MKKIWQGRSEKRVKGLGDVIVFEQAIHDFICLNLQAKADTSSWDGTHAESVRQYAFRGHHIVVTVTAPALAFDPARDGNEDFDSTLER